MDERDVAVLKQYERELLREELTACSRFFAALARMRAADAALWAVTRPGGCAEVEEWYAAGVEYADAAEAVESFGAFPPERWWA